MDNMTMRFVVVPLAVLLAFAATLRGQSWPSNAQVFRDVYGQEDAGGTSVRWDAAKESQPSPYDGRSFAETGQEMAVKVLLRGEVNGRLYVATSAVPKAPVEYNCHACMAALGAVVYRRANGTWKLEASSPVAIYAGGWGGPPVGIELRRCGERTYCFVVEDWFTAQGYSESKLKVFGPVGGSVRPLLSAPFESEAPGATKKVSASVRFEPVSAGRAAFFDLEVVGVRRDCSSGRCANSWEYRRYRYSGGEYDEVAISPQRAKAK